MSQKTTMKTKKKSPETNLIPIEFIEATTTRLQEAMDSDSNLLSKSTSELLSQNSVSAIESRLVVAGLSPKAASGAAKAASKQAGIPRAVLSEVSDLDISRFERILGVDDLIDVRFLLAGATKTAAIGRVQLSGGFATGFLVAPGVLMTNWHVFGSEDDARNARIEFGYRELDRYGQLSQPTTFGFDVDRLFFSDRSLDVAVVAVGNRIRGNLNLRELPFCPLVQRSDAVLTGERLNIIQHPAGEPKQVAIRDNTVIAVVDETFLQYKSDTKRGSSGSPVFNDEWDLVGLHHAGVPRTNADGDWLAIDGSIWTRSMGDHRIDWIANEGIQSSALYRLLGQQEFRGDAAELIEQLLNPPESSISEASRPVDDIISALSSDNRHVTTLDTDGTARVTVPIEITVRLGGGKPSEVEMTLNLLFERFGIDRDYSNRGGYDNGFLNVEIPIPKLTTEDQESVSARNREATDGQDPFELPYHNFSLIMNGERRIPFFTAVNVDGGNPRRISRDDEGGAHSWILDERIGSHEQTNNDFYRGRRNRLDRGHLVRRLDPGWGATWRDSARGIVDTFHYTNCSPQYDRFNRTAGPDGLWLGLENYILDNAQADRLRVDVFTGPVFRDDDPDYRDNGLLIPRQYWKIVAWCDDDGELQSAAFLLSQEALLEADADIEALPAEAFDFRGRTLFQSTVGIISELTDLDFGPLDEIDEEDELAIFESKIGVPLHEFRDIVV